MTRQRQFPATIVREDVEYRRGDTPVRRDRRDGARKALYQTELPDEEGGAPNKHTVVVYENDLSKYAPRGVSTRGPAESSMRTTIFERFEFPWFRSKRKAS